MGFTEQLNELLARLPEDRQVTSLELFNNIDELYVFTARFICETEYVLHFARFRHCYSRRRSRSFLWSLRGLAFEIRHSFDWTSTRNSRRTSACRYHAKVFPGDYYHFFSKFYNDYVAVQSPVDSKIVFRHGACLVLRSSLFVAEFSIVLRSSLFFFFCILNSFLQCGGRTRCRFSFIFCETWWGRTSRRLCL